MKQLNLFETKEQKPPIALRRQDVCNLIYTIYKNDQENLFIGLNEYVSLKDFSEFINIFDSMIFAKNARIRRLEATLGNKLDEFSTEMQSLDLYSLFRKLRDKSSYVEYHKTLKSLKNPLTKKGNNQIEGELIAAEAIVKYGLERDNVKKGVNQIEKKHPHLIQRLKDKLNAPAVIYCKEKDYIFYRNKYDNSKLPYHIEIRPLIPAFKGTQYEKDIKKGKHFAKKSSEN